MGNTIDITVIEECTKLAFEDKISFPETVKRFMAIGVEHYHADLSRLEKIYYSLSGEFAQHTLPLNDPPAIAEDFSEAGVVEALRAIQGGKISYDVFLLGRKALYTGR